MSRELAQTSVCMAVEAVDEGFVVELSSKGPKSTVVERCLELTTDVEAATLVLPKHIKHLFDAC